MAETDSPEINCVYVDTNLDTHLAVLVHNHETISDFKEKLCKEHELCFPKVGEINISAVKVKRQNPLGVLLDYHLSDSMYLSMAFDGVSNDCWFVFVDAAVIIVDKRELPITMDADEDCSNHELLEKDKEIATDSLLLDGYTNVPGEDLETLVAEKTTKKRKLKSLDGEVSRKKPLVDPNQSATASRFDVDENHEPRGNVQVEVVASESSPRERLDETLTEATGREVEMGENYADDMGRDKIETESHPANLLDTNSGLTTRPDTEKRKKRKKRSKADIDQPSAAAITTSRDIVSEITPANADRVDATPESLPVSRGENLENPFAEAIQKENEMGENSVDDVGRDKVETDNVASHTANHVDSNNLEKETKKRRKKRSKDDINQSSAAAVTTSRDIVSEINGVPGNVDIVNATSESPLVFRRDNLGNPFAEASQNENEMVEKSVEDVGRHNIEDNSGLTTRLDTEKKKRRKKRSKDDINQSSAATITTSRDIVNEINGVPANVDLVDAAPETPLVFRREILGNPSAQAREKETEADEKIDDDVGSEKAIPSAADNLQTHNVEIDADEAKSVKSTKKRKSKKAKTPAEEDTLVASGVQNVEPIEVVGGEGTDNVIRNVLDSLQEKNETEEDLEKTVKKSTEENLEKTVKKSSKKSKKKNSLKVAESQVLSVEVNNAALEETPTINNPKDTDASIFTPTKKDTESDASLLKKSTEVADNAEDNGLFKKILIEKADMGDNFGCSQKEDDTVGGGKKQEQVAGGAKSKKEKKGLDLHPSGSINGSLSSMKPKEKKGRVHQPASSGTSHLQSMVKNDRSRTLITAVNSKKQDVKISSKPPTVDKRKTNFFEDAEKCDSSEDEYNKTSDFSTKTPSDYSSDDDSDVTSMSKKQGNNLDGGTNKLYSGSLQDILRRSSSYKKALIRAQSQPDILDDVDCVPDSQAV